MRLSALAVILLAALVAAPPLMPLLMRERNHVAIPEPLGLVSVAVDGREVYRDSMHSFTPEAIDWLRVLLFLFSSSTTHIYGAWWPPSDPFLPEYYSDTWNGIPTRTPAFVRAWLGVRYSNGSDGVLVSTIGKSWGYNSTHSGFFITASFVAPEDVKLKWIALRFWSWYPDGTPFRWIVMSNDTLPSVTIPANTPFAVTLMLYWRDNGALMENWFRVLHAVLLHAGYVAVELHGASGRFVMMEGSGSHIVPSEYAGRIRVSVALGTDCRANPNRTLHSLFNEVARVTPSIAITSKGLALSFTTPTSNICEIGIYMGYTSEPGTWRWSEALLLRYVINPVPEGTTITLYLLPPPGE